MRACSSSFCLFSRSNCLNSSLFQSLGAVSRSRWKHCWHSLQQKKNMPQGSCWWQYAQLRLCGNMVPRDLVCLQTAKRQLRHTTQHQPEYKSLIALEFVELQFNVYAAVLVVGQRPINWAGDVPCVTAASAIYRPQQNRYNKLQRIWNKSACLGLWTLGQV